MPLSRFPPSISPHSHIETINRHDVEVAQLRGSDGEIGWNRIIFIDHQARHAPASLHRESLQIFRNVSLQVEFVHDMEIALRQERSRLIKDLTICKKANFFPSR